MTYFLMSITMPGLQSSDIRHIRQMMSALSMAWARLRN